MQITITYQAGQGERTPSHCDPRADLDQAAAQAGKLLKEFRASNPRFPLVLFFGQQRLILLRLANGKPPTGADLLRLAACACSPGISSELQESVA